MPAQSLTTAVESPRHAQWAAWIAGTAAGEDVSLAALYDASAPVVNGLALRILGDRSAAEEVTMDVYLQIWRRAVTYDPARGAPLAWLLTMARSRALDRARVGATRRSRTESLRRAYRLASVEPGPEQGTALAERRRLVQQAVERLPVDQRRALELAYFAGLSHGEIAECLRLPLGTVKTRIRIGMTRLRQALAACAGEDVP